MEFRINSFNPSSYTKLTYCHFDLITQHCNFCLVAEVYLKILIPSIAAGAVIGKGGETISLFQKETGTNVKMSKGGDYYPGIRLRVTL